MAVTITATNYPEFSGLSGVSGKVQKLYINYGTGATEEEPVWVKVGGIASTNLSLSADVKTVQTKDSGYWAEGGLTSKSGELSATVYVKRNDVGQAAIEEFMLDDSITEAKNLLMLALVDEDTNEYMTVKGVPTSWETTAASDDLLQKSLKLTVIGAPVKATGFTATNA